MNFSFYMADMEYCNYLREQDSNVPYTMDKKAGRPFVGVVIKVGKINYYAPLTSPKAKHITMKNQIDFIKINDGKWGAINLNNMIPIHINSLSKIQLNSMDTDTKQDIDYKNLLKNQLSWCNSNSTNIISKAEKLYNAVIINKRHELVKRCCNFKLDEQRMLDYCVKMKLEI